MDLTKETRLEMYWCCCCLAGWMKRLGLAARQDRLHISGIGQEAAQVRAAFALHRAGGSPLLCDLA